jgi:glycosyltransferase involved in cell wall biosynthesis
MGALVSILIPCYNAERWIAQAIESALAQTWPQKEIIVIDDGSTDRSLNVIKQFDGRISWETGPNRGGNAARNRLLELARGEWVQYLDADDYLLCDKIAGQMAFLAKHPGTDIVFGPVTWEYLLEVDARRELLPIAEPHDPWILLASWGLPQTGGPLWRRQAILDVGGWKRDQPCCQEHELYLRLLTNEKRFAYHSANGAVYRQWSNETVCKRDIPEVHRRRLEIEQRLEDHLRETNQLTSERLRAINQARFQIARLVWQYDAHSARDIVDQVQRLDTTFLPTGAAAPAHYRLAFRLLGFGATERIASAVRKRIRHLDAAIQQSALDDPEQLTNQRKGFWNAVRKISLAMEDTISSRERNTTECDLRTARYLLLAADDGMQGDHSGYTRLADYVERCTLVTAPRVEPRKFHERALVRMINALAASRWYRMGSLKLEWRAWRALQTGFEGVVHIMWAERDWGFLDQLPSGIRPPAICATFHSCPDTLPEVVQRTRRLQNFSAIILMSEVQRAFFELHGVPRDRIHVIPHGVDCKFFSPDASVRTGQFTVLFVGNYRRNFMLLRQVCSMLEPYDICIKIVASRSRTDMFRDLKNVIVFSGLSNDELRSSYREASCLLMTLEAATANNAILEAMACGLPIVSEDVGGVAEYCGSCCARLCAPGSAEALKESILMLYREPDMIARMSLRARERAEEFDWPVIAKRTVRLYDELLAEVRERK